VKGWLFSCTASEECDFLRTASSLRALVKADELSDASKSCARLATITES
jgi:hypothetical protein